MKIYISPPHTNRADNNYIRHAMAMCFPSVGSCINVIFLRSCQSSVILKALQWTSQWELSGPCTGGHSPALSAGCCACYNGAQTQPLSDHITPPGIGIHFTDLTGSGAAAVGAYSSWRLLGAAFDSVFSLAATNTLKASSIHLRL